MLYMYFRTSYTLRDFQCCVVSSCFPARSAFGAVVLHYSANKREFHVANPDDQKAEQLEALEVEVVVHLRRGMQ